MLRGPRSVLLSLLPSLVSLLVLSIASNARAQPAPAQPVYIPPPSWVQPAPPFELAGPPRGLPRGRRPWPSYVWRIRAELGGTVAMGRAQPYVADEPVRWRRAGTDVDILHDVFDARLTLDRLFGAWFGLGLQLGFSSWQSEYLAALDNPRSETLSLLLAPELRPRMGKCRGCPILLLGVRLGAALSIPGQYGQADARLADAQLGGGPVWGAQMGLELPVAARVRLRASLGYEGAKLRHRVTYGALGSELVSFRIDRPYGSLGVAIGVH